MNNFLPIQIIYQQSEYSICITAYCIKVVNCYHLYQTLVAVFIHPHTIYIHYIYICYKSVQSISALWYSIFCESHTTINKCGIIWWWSVSQCYNKIFFWHIAPIFCEWIRDYIIYRQWFLSYKSSSNFTSCIVYSISIWLCTADQHDDFSKICLSSKQLVLLYFILENKEQHKDDSATIIALNVTTVIGIAGCIFFGIPVLGILLHECCRRCGREGICFYYLCSGIFN